MLNIATASLYDTHKLALKILSGSAAAPDFFTELCSADSDADMISYRFCATKGHILLSPDAIKDALVYKSSHFDRPENVRRAMEFFNRPNVFSSLGSVWQRQRQSLAPHLKRDGVTCPQSVIQDSINEDFRFWDAPDGINLSDELGCMTLRVFFNTMFSQNLERSHAHELSKSVIHAQNHIFRKALLGGVIGANTSPSLSRAFRHAHDNISGTLDDMITARRSIWHDRPQDMLSSHMEKIDYAEDATTEKHIQLKEELLVLLGAGHETLKTSLFWAIYHLSNAPEVYAALQDEVDERALPRRKIGDKAAPMRLSQYVLMEAMRLNPPNFAIFRKANQDTDIMGAPVKSGEYVSVPYNHLHRSPKYWTDAANFNPTVNFNESRFKDLPREVFGPFGHGPRSCPGKGMALQEGRLILSCLAQRFNITAPIAQTEPRYLGLSVVDQDRILTLKKRDDYTAPAPS